MITPNGVIKFLNVPFSPSQNNVLKFTNESTQISYMNILVGLTLSNCGYVRNGENGYIPVNRNIDTMHNFNYVMFQNTNYGDKWFYAFIDKLEWGSNNSTYVHIILDVWQTYQFDFTLKKSFIDRQTFNTDYYNTLSDVPSTGDLKTVFEYTKNLSGHFFVLFNADPTIEDSSQSGSDYPLINNYSVPCYMAFFQTSSEMSEVVQAISNKGRADRIQACYFAPCKFGVNDFEIQLMPKGDLNITNDYINLLHDLPYEFLYEDITVSLNYTPTFKKELSYPYSKLEIVDKITGRFIELDLSKFVNPLSPQFRIIYDFTGSSEYKIIPLNYNGISYSIENSLVVNPNTDLPIFSNMYSKYVKDNQGSNIINGVMSVATGLSSAMVGNVGGVMGSFANIANVINSDSVARKQPNQISGITGNGMEYINFSPCLYFRLKVMDSDHLNIARNFWRSFGYPVRKIDTVNMSVTPDFLFIKSEGINMIADSIPSQFLRTLENIFNKGVTVWNRNYLEY